MAAATFTPKVVKGYQLVEQIGSGGFGIVYRANQLSVNREVAVKAILPSYANHPAFIRRFDTEAQLIAHMEHPFIVPLFDYWREPNEAYLVMRFLRGGSLRHRLEEGPLPLREVLHITTQVASALELAHRNQVIHRDIKPDNILLDDDGNAFLTDFGLSVVKDTQDTGEGGDFISGSPAYMSPEQLQGEPPSLEIDIYALGIVLYEMLTGQHPFTLSPMGQLIEQHLYHLLPEIDTMPAYLNHLIQKATAKDPRERYHSTLELMRDLRIALQDDSVTSSQIVHRVLQNPYKGLRAFVEADAANFFGRESLTAQLLERMREASALANFIAVVGPSGSGKSSVVSAGLVPAIRAGEISGSEHWYVVQMVPGSQPIDNLTSSLLGIASRPIERLSEKLHQQPEALLNALHDIGGTTLLVIDQFEEAFTLVEQESERAQFLELLRVALTAPDSPLRLVITLRADFTDRPLHYVEFGALMRQRTEFVLPLSTKELERAIVEPARRMGLQVAPDLVAAIISDVRDEPGALPLLQYALTEVFERHTGNVLTLEPYRDSGGVLGALARRAQKVYDSLDAHQQHITRQIFLRLVTLGEGVHDTRRRARQAELQPLGEAVESVLGFFGKYRLLTFDVEPSTREPMVEVAHEALIRTWGQLHEWLDESRSDIRLQRWLTSAANEWERSGRDKSYLLTGTRLAQYEEWQAKTDLALTGEELAYLHASTAQRLHLEAAESERLAREERKVIEMQSLALTANARQNAVQNLPDIALALSLEATRIPDPPDQVQQMLFEIAPAPGTRRLFAGHTDTIWGVAVSADERYILTASGGFSPATNFYNKMPTYLPLNTRSAPYSDNSARLWDTQTGEQLQLFKGHSNTVTSVAFAADGQHAISASADGSICMWALADGREVLRLQHPAQVLSIAVHGERLLASSYDFESDSSQLILWNLQTGEEIRHLEGQADVIFCVAISPDGKTALSGSGSSGPYSPSSGNNDIVLWNLETGERLRQLRGHSDAVFNVAYRHNSAQALSSSADSTLRVWDLTTGELLQTIAAHNTFAYAMAISPLGLRAFSASFDLAQVLWDVDRSQDITHFYGHNGHVTSAVFLPNGRQILTGSNDNTARLWDVYSADEMGRLSAPAGMGMWAVASNGRQVVTSAGSMELFAPPAPNNPLHLWDLESGRLVRELGSHQNTVFDALFLPDGEHILSISGDFFMLQADNSMVLRDLEGRELRRYRSPGSAFSGMALLPDGEHVAVIVFGDEIQIMNIYSGEVRRRLAGSVPAFRGIAVTADGRRLLSGSATGVLTVWDLHSGESLHELRGHLSHIYHVAIAPGGRYAVTASDDTQAIVWDIEQGKRLFTFRQHTSRLQAVAIAPNHDWALTGDNSGNLLLWEIHTGKVLRRYEGHRRAIWSIVFSQDGSQALTSAADGHLIRWRIAPQRVEELVAWTLDNRMVREFTCDERELYRIEPLCPPEEESQGQGAGGAAAGA